MADGLFGDGAFGQFLMDPQTQLALSLMAQPMRDPQGRRRRLGQQLGGAYEQFMGLQQMQAAARAQQMQMQQAERQAKLAQKKQEALEQFQARSTEYTDEAGNIKPKAALNLALKLGITDPMEAITAASRLKRYQPIGGMGVLDTETEQFLQAPPPEFTKLNQGQMLGQYNEAAGGYEPTMVNPRTFAPRAAGGGGGRQPRMVVVPDESSPTGYSWQPATAGQTATPPSTGRGGAGKATISPANAASAAKMIEGMQADITAGEGTLTSVVGPKGAATRVFETAKGLIPGQQFSATPALDFAAKKEIIIAQLRKTINPDPNWTKADRQNFQRLMGEFETAGTAGSAVRALDGLKEFTQTLGGQAAPAGGGAKTVIRRLRNKNTGQIKIEYSDGTSEIQ